MTTHSTPTLVYLFTTFPPEVTGSAYYNWERVQWLARLGSYRIVVLAPEWQDAAALPTVPSDLAHSLILETYPAKPWLLYPLLRVPTFSAAKQIRERLAYYQPDLITVVDLERLFWFSTWHLPGRGYAKEHQIPYITEYHTDYYNHLSTYPLGNWLRNLFLKPISRYLYHQCDQTIAISTTSGKILQQLGITNFQVLPIYGLDLSAYSPQRRKRQWLESWLPTEIRDHQVILFLGRLALEKRIDLLIESFARLRQKHHKLSLLIVGDGPDNATSILKRLAQPISNIYFTGFVYGEMKANLLASCDVYCSPAPYETFGRTLIEAMASGVPVITVNSGGVSDYIKDGVNGYLVTPNNVDKLTDALENALLHSDVKITQQALQDAKQFSLEQAGQNLIKCYGRFLDITSKNANSKNTKTVLY